MILQFRRTHRHAFDHERPVAHSGMTVCRHATARAWLARLPLDDAQRTVTEGLITAGLPKSPLDALHWECHALALLRQLAERLRTPCAAGSPETKASAPPPPARDRRALLAALRHIEHAYAEPLHVDEVARVAGLGVHALQQGFRQLFGDSVHGAVIRRRVADSNTRTPNLLAALAHHCDEWVKAFASAARFARVQPWPWGHRAFGATSLAVTNCERFALTL